MRRRLFETRNAFASFVPFVSFVLPLLFPSFVFAQLPDAVGVRAQGMGGAFTALADDASAGWWNPAGLASGAFLNVSVEYGELNDPPIADAPSHRGVAFAFPALGLSYYRMPVSEIAPTSSTDAAAGSRQDPGTPSVRTVELSQFGVTLGQSIGNHFVLATTFKLLHASVAGDDTEGDLDIGGMVAFGRLRAGVTVRNVREATFGEEFEAFTMRRQVRAGAAWASNLVGIGVLGFAVDADIRRVVTALGEERRVAGGGELWILGRTVGVRGGVSGSTVGHTRESHSGGVSVAVRRGIYAEGQLTGGSDELRRGWSTGFRVTF